MMELESYLLNKAYRYLAARDHSRQGLAAKLRRACQRSKAWQDTASGEFEKALAATLVFLTERGYLDDHRFACDFIQSRMEHKPRGLYLIQQELRQRGVDDQTIRQASQETDLAAREEELARRLAAKKAATLASLGREKRYEKLGRYLSQKGFSQPLVIKVLKQTLDKGN